MRAARRWILLLWVVACGGSASSQTSAGLLDFAETAPAARLATPAHGVSGERMVFDVRFRGVSIGRIRIAVGEPGLVGGRPAIIVRSAMESGALLSLVRDLYWRLTTTLDLESGYPISEESVYSAEFRGDVEEETRTRTWTATSTLHNLHSTIGVLRAWDAEPGARASFRMRVAGRFRVEIALTGREYSKAYRRPALRIDGRAMIGREHPFTIWVADDACRAPLRFDVETRWGGFSAVLVRYRSDCWQWPERRRLRGIAHP